MDAKETLVFELKKRKMHISTAESCTAGLVAATIVDVSGASEVFEEGYITYSDRVKQKVLHVPKEVLKVHTAVSRQTAEWMAKGCIRLQDQKLPYLLPDMRARLMQKTEQKPERFISVPGIRMNLL